MNWKELLLLLCWCFTGWLPVQGCEYMFSEQPLSSLPCNPYSTQLRLDCTVLGDASTFTIQWIFSSPGGETHQLTNSQEGVHIEETGEAMRKSSSIILNIVDGRVGEYSCAVRTNENMVGWSSRLQLSPPTAYTGRENCSSQELYSQQGMECVTLVPTTMDLGGVLYAVIGVIVVFCLVILSLTVIIVLLIRRKCGRADFKTADHHRQAQSNPYSGFAHDLERANGQRSSLDDPTHLPRPHHITAHSPSQLLTASTAESAEDYSRLDHTLQQTANKTTSGYSKLIIEATPTSDTPPTFPPHRSRIYSDLEETDTGQEATSTHNPLEKRDKSSGIFDDPEYSPLRGGVAPSSLRINPKYRGDYERDPNYIPTPPPRGPNDCSQHTADEESRFVISGEFSKEPGDKELVLLRQNELSKYRGDYERSPNYVPPPLKSLPGAGRKYSGNYERDPLYMAQLLRKAKRSQSAESAHSYENSEIVNSCKEQSSELQQGTFMDL